jgi:hypothetical protein
MSYTIKGNSQGKVSDVTLVYSTGGRSHDVVVIYILLLNKVWVKGLVELCRENANFVDLLLGKPMSELVKNIRQKCICQGG